MERVLVVGITGSGKTTFARALGGRTGLPFHELDALALGPGWTTPPGFERDVERITSGDKWILDSHGYPQVTAVMWQRADTIVWLDYPRRITFTRALRRSAWRTLTRQRVFNGNREALSEWFGADHPAWSSWTGHAARRELLSSKLADPANARLTVHRLTSPAIAQSWLGNLEPVPGRSAS